MSSNRDLSYNEFAANTSTHDQYQVERLSQLKRTANGAEENSDFEGSTMNKHRIFNAKGSITTNLNLSNPTIQGSKSQKQNNSFIDKNKTLQQSAERNNSQKSDLKSNSNHAQSHKNVELVDNISMQEAGKATNGEDLNRTQQESGKALQNLRA